MVSSIFMILHSRTKFQSTAGNFIILEAYSVRGELNLHDFAFKEEVPIYSRDFHTLLPYSVQGELP